MVQSRFLSWVSGTIVFGQSQLHQLAKEVIKTDSFRGEVAPTSNNLSMIDQSRKLVTVLNLSGYPADQHFLTLITSSLLVSGACFLLAYYISRNLKRKISPKVKKRMVVFVSTIFFAPYFLVISVLTKGEITKFQQKITNQVYSYGGQFQEVIPYLKDNLEDRDQIILIAPPTGIPYYLNHPVVDILNTYGLKKLKPALDLSNDQEIKIFLKENNMKYLLIREDNETVYRLGRLQDKFFFFSHITNQENYQKIIDTTQTSSWVLYRLY